MESPLMREGETERRRDREERACKMKAQELGCVFIWCVQQTPGRQQAPEICIANGPHISHILFPIYNLIPPQCAACVFECLCSGGDVLTESTMLRAQRLSNVTFIVTALSSPLQAVCVCMCGYA